MSWQRLERTTATRPRHAMGKRGVCDPVGKMVKREGQMAGKGSRALWGEGGALDAEGGRGSPSNSGFRLAQPLGCR